MAEENRTLTVTLQATISETEHFVPLVKATLEGLGQYHTQLSMAGTLGAEGVWTHPETAVVCTWSAKSERIGSVS